MSAIDIRHISKCYRSLQALKDVTFSIEEGEFFGLLGPNGAGKTTLISSMPGLVKPTREMSPYWVMTWSWIIRQHEKPRSRPAGTDFRPVFYRQGNLAAAIRLFRAEKQ